MCNETCKYAALFPANVLEQMAFGTDYVGKPMISNRPLRNLVRRLVALVAPFFHVLEAGINLLRIPFHLIAFCFSIDCLKYPFRSDVGLNDLLLDERAGAISCALNSISDCFSSICEMPQKLICGHDVNYFGREGRYDGYFE